MLRNINIKCLQAYKKIKKTSGRDFASHVAGNRVKSLIFFLPQMLVIESFPKILI